MKQKIEIQAAIITLSDGRKLTFVGRAQIRPTDNDKNIRATAVEFTVPKEMELEENEHLEIAGIASTINKKAAGV